MRPIAPRIKDADELSYDGDDWNALTYSVVPTEEGRVGYVTRWRPTDEERERLLRGEDIFFITIGILPPQQVHVGWPYGELE